MVKKYFWSPANRQPTPRNYIGAIKNFVNLQNQKILNAFIVL